MIYKPPSSSEPVVRIHLTEISDKDAISLATLLISVRNELAEKGYNLTITKKKVSERLYM